MDKISKLIFYFEPKQSCGLRTRSYTLSFSRIDKKSNIYKQKAILQYWSEERNTIEEYKMKEVHIGADILFEKIKNIDFNRTYTPPNDNSDKLYICYNGKQITIGNVKEVEDILNEFNFFDLYKISHKHYNHIKDMNEYIILKKILYKKAEDLSIEKQVLLDDIFKSTNPYVLFQSIPYLQEYLYNLEVRT
jgi:hypothetical protein